jgi:hypothetical protein
MPACRKIGDSRRLVVLLATGVGLIAFAGCGPSTPSSTAQVCNEAARTELLKANLEPWILSAPFTLPAGSEAWIQVTKLPAASEGLFGTVAGIAELHWIPNGAAPTVVTASNGGKESKDPFIEVQKAPPWQKMALAAGAWQLYSVSDPGIEVVSCPRTGN